MNIWNKIDVNNIPEEEVLAANFEPFTHGYKEKIVGSLYFDTGKVVCENEHEVLENCSHYLKIHDFDIE